MKLAIFAYSRQGCRTARRIMSLFPEAEWKAHTLERFEEDGFLPLSRPSRPFYGDLFDWADALIFVGSCGIAVRETAPHVADKRTDPAVICVDELGKFVISLLSGHIGGANSLARQIASGIEAVPVITTATDINGRFSVDSWAAKNSFVIDDMRLAKAVSAAILEDDVPLSCDFPIATDLPSGVVSGDGGELGISVSCFKKTPFKKTLRIVPRILHLGVGCRKGTAKETIAQAVDAVLEENGIDIRAVGRVASIDLKADEAGLLEYCADNGWSPRFFTADELREVKGDFTPSEFVQSVTGVDNVCERAALIGADRIIVKKTALNGVTVAIASENLEVRFE